MFIADPSIADVKVLSTNEIYVFGKKAGITSLQAISGNKRGSGDGDSPRRSSFISATIRKPSLMPRKLSRNPRRSHSTIKASGWWYVATHGTSMKRLPGTIRRPTIPTAARRLTLPRWTVRTRSIFVCASWKSTAPRCRASASIGVFGVNAGSFSLGVSKTSFIGRAHTQPVWLRQDRQFQH